MELRNRIVAALNFVQTEQIPYTLPISESVAEQLDEHFGDTEWRSAIKDHIASLQIPGLRSPKSKRKRAKDVFGSTWRTGEYTALLDSPALPEADLSGYKWPTSDDLWDEKALFKQVEDARKRDQFIVLDTGFGIFERSCTLRGYENALQDMLLHPDFYEELLDKILDTHIAIVDKLDPNSVDAVMLCDDWGIQGGITMGAELWRRFLKPRVARYFDAVHDKKLWAFLHCSGDVYEIIPDLIDIGMDAIQGLQPEIVDYYNLKRRYGHRMRLWGGLGTLHFLPFKSPKQVRAEIDRLKVNMGFGGGFILAPSKPITAEVPLKNTLAVLQAFTGMKIKGSSKK